MQCHTGVREASLRSLCCSLTWVLRTATLHKDSEAASYQWSTSSVGCKHVRDAFAHETERARKVRRNTVGAHQHAIPPLRNMRERSLARYCVSSPIVFAQLLYSAQSISEVKLFRAQNRDVDEFLYDRERARLRNAQDRRNESSP